MALASGLAGQIGFKTEVTPGTAVTVDKFVPLVSESITNEMERLESDAIIAGRRVLDSGQWNGGNITVGGDIGFELYNLGLETLLHHCFGVVTTTGSGPYTHTFTPGDMVNNSFTVQVGRPGTKGTVHPFTYAGCHVASWELACAAGEIATLGLTIAAMSETNAPALAAASMPAGIKPVKFNHASITVAGTSTSVKSVNLKGDNGLDTDRRSLGSQLIRQPLEADLRTYDGTLEMEFEDLAMYQRYLLGTEQALVIAFTVGTSSLTITCNVRFDGETPGISGKELLQQSLPFKCVGSSDAAAITAVYVTPTASAA